MIALYEPQLLKFGLLQKHTAEAFFENVDDIINEEEFEESVINQSIRKGQVLETSIDMGAS